MWQIITGGITTMVKGWFDYRAKKIEAKSVREIKVIEGQQDYNVAAQQGMAASIKDEVLMFWTLGLMTIHFIPYFQPYLRHGWDMLANVAPDWFGYCVVGMYVAVYGLKGWKIFKE